MSLSESQSWNCKPQKSNIATTTFIAATYLYILAITVTPLDFYTKVDEVSALEGLTI